MTFRVEFYPFFNSCLSIFWGKDPTSWNVAGTQSVQLHINTCKLMPGLPKISRPFLTAVSRVHSAKNTKQRKGWEKVDFFRLWLFLGIFYFCYPRFLQKLELPEPTTDSQRQKTLSVSAISNQVSRCCINFNFRMNSPANVWPIRT